MKKWLTILFCFVCLQVPAYGADSPSGGTRGYADKWALVIGVNSYPDQKAPLKYGENDAKKFHDFLVNDVNFAPSHVMLLQGKDATFKNISEKIAELKKLCQNDDLLVVYLRTPGINASHIGSAYFAASDTSMATLESTAFEMENFPLSLARSIKVADLAVILDSDFSGNTLKPNSQVSYSALREKEPQKRLYVYTSTDVPGRTAESEDIKGSVFSGLLIDKLRSDPLALLSKSVSATQKGCSNCSSGEVMLSTPSFHPRKFSPKGSEAPPEPTIQELFLMKSRKKTSD